MFCFGVVKVIAALFIAETNRLAAVDDELAVMQAQRKKTAYLQKLWDVFKELDSNDDGKITWHEFETLFHEERMRTWLTTLEIDVTDLHELFRILDDGDGCIGLEEFIRGVGRVRGQARSMDLIAVQKQVLLIHQKLDGYNKRQDSSKTPLKPRPMLKQLLQESMEHDSEEAEQD